MEPAQLRRWMQKYGNPGVLVVALYLGFYYLWTQRRNLVLILCLILLGSSLVFYRIPRSSQLPPEHVAAPSEPPSQPGEIQDQHVYPPGNLLAKATKIADTTEWNLHTHAGVQPYQDYFWAASGKVFFFKNDETISRLLCQIDLATGKETQFRKVSQMWDKDGFYKQYIAVSPNGEWVLWNGDWHDHDYHGFYCARLDGSRKFHGTEGGWQWMPDGCHLLEITGYGDDATGKYILQKAMIRSVEQPHITRKLSRKQGEFYLEKWNKHLVSDNRMILEEHEPQYHLEEWKMDREPKRLHSWTISLPETVARHEMKISPNGRCLAWILIKPTNATNYYEATLCSSEIDGSHLQEIGHLNVPPTESDGSISDFTKYPHDLKWLLDGKRLSFLYNETLYTIPAR